MRKSRFQASDRIANFSPDTLTPFKKRKMEKGLHKKRNNLLQNLLDKQLGNEYNSYSILSLNLERGEFR